MHHFQALWPAALLILCGLQESYGAPVGQESATALTQDSELYGLLRGGAVGKLDGDTLAFYDTGRIAKGSEDPAGVLYRLQLNVNTGKLECHWATKCDAPVLDHNAAIKLVPGIGHLEARLALRSSSGGFALYDAATGEHLQDFLGENILDYASVPGIGQVAVTSYEGALRLRIADQNDPSGDKVIDTDLRAPTAASVINAPSRLRIVVARLASRDAGVPGNERTTISIAEALEDDTINEEVLWSSPLRLLSSTDLIASRAEVFAAALQDESTGRIVVLGQLAANTEVTTVRDERGTSSYYYPCLGRAMTFLGGQLLVSRPGDPEVSNVWSYALPSAVESWELPGFLGANLGTRLEGFGQDYLLISSGALGAGLANRNGAIRLYKCAEGEGPKLLAAVKEESASRVIRAGLQTSNTARKDR